MVFAIYSVASAGTALWSTTHSGASAVAVTNGSFSVNIGSLDANGVNIAMDTPPYYLGVKVGTNAEMTPRIQLGFSPFAMTAKNMSNIYEVGGNVGIGTTGPSRALDVVGTIYSSSSVQTAGPVYAQGGSLFLGYNQVGSNTASEMKIGQFGSSFMTLYSNNAEALRITTSGNVGIGTTGPTQKLDVVGTILQSGIYYNRYVTATSVTFPVQMGPGNENQTGLYLIYVNSVNMTAYPRSSGTQFGIFLFQYGCGGGQCSNQTNDFQVTTVAKVGTFTPSFSYAINSGVITMSGLPCSASYSCAVKVIDQGVTAAIN